MGHIVQRPRLARLALATWAVGVAVEVPAAAPAGASQGETEAAAVDLYGDPLPPGARVRLGTLRFRRGGYFPQHPIRFLPGTHQVVMGTVEAGLGVWDAETGRQVRAFRVAGHSVRAFGLLPDGAGLAALVAGRAAENGQKAMQIRLWQWKSGRERTVAGWTESVREGTRSIAPAPDGLVVATGSRTGKLRVWDVASGVEILRYELATGEIQSLAFSPDGQVIAAAGRGGVAFWEWLTGREPEVILDRASGYRGAISLAFSPDGRWLATGGVGRRGIRVWDAAARQLAWQIEAAEASYYAQGLAFTPDSRQLAVPVYRGEGGVELREAATGRLIAKLDGDQLRTRDAAVSSDGTLVAAQTTDSAFTVWKLPGGERLDRPFVGHRESPLPLAFTPDGRKLVSADYRGTVRVWDVPRGRQLHRLDHDDARAVVAIALSPDGKRVASSSFDDTLRLWDLDSGRQVYQLCGHGQLGAYANAAVGFTPDGSRLISFGNDFYLRTWDMQTGKALEECVIRPAGLDLEVSQDGEVTVAGSRLFADPMDQMIVDHALVTADGRWLLWHMRHVEQPESIRFLETETGKETRRFQPDRQVAAMSISPDGRFLVTVEQEPPDGSGPAASRRASVICLRDFRSGEVVREIRPEGRIDRQIVFSPDGRLLAAPCLDQPEDGANRYGIRLWDVASGREGAGIDPLPGRAFQVAFSPDAKRLATSHGDGTILVWDLGRFRREP